MSKKLIHWAIPFYAVFGLIGMAPANIGFGLVLFAYLLCIFFLKMKWNPFFPTSTDASCFSLEFKTYLRVGFFLFTACMLSLVAAQLWPLSYAGHAPEITLHGFHKIWYLAIPFILVAVFQTAPSLPHEFKKITYAWWVITLCLAPVAIIQFYTGWPLLQRIPTNPGRFHAILFQGHHLSVASIFIFPTFTALACAFGSYTRTQKFLFLECWVGIAGILILFLSYARTAWIAVPIGIIFIFIRYLHRKSLYWGLSTLGIGLLILSQSSFTQERIKNSMGIQDRFRLWEANLDFFKHRPLTGIGWLKTQEMSEFYFKQNFPAHYHEYFWGHAHNNFFEMLGGTGLLGLIAFIAWSLFTLLLAKNMAYESLKNREFYLADFSWGLGIALILLHFNGLTNVTFWEGKVMHQQMFAVGMLLMIGVMNRKQMKRE